jgi:hypothetical protein
MIEANQLEGAIVGAYKENFIVRKLGLVEKTDLAGMYRSTKTPPVFTRMQTDSTLEFSGMDDAQKVHGVAGDLCWINEAMEANFESFKQLLQRSRGKFIPVVLSEIRKSVCSDWIPVFTAERFLIIWKVEKRFHL